ncbi:MAG: aldolase/citrate lyase family protein [Kiloniellales bacterium]
MRENPVKKKLAEGGTVYGTMMFEFLSPGLPQMLANAGADFVFYDMEHSGFTVSDMKQQAALCRGLKVVPLVRPPGKDYQFAARLLDVGAMGLLFQMVESAEEARELVSWTRYPPRGKRGAIFGGAHDDYAGGDMGQKALQAEERTLTTVLIETAAGLENVEEIMAVEGVDAAHLGHADLSLSLGVPGQFDHPKLQAGIDRIVEAAERNGKAAASLAPDPKWGEDLLGRGYRMMSYGYDIGLFTGSLTQGINALRETSAGRKA